jgi:hypothetical protein
MPSPFDATQIAPWRTWGNTANVRLFGAGPAVQSQPNQLANVEYDRPDTWSWLFALRLQGDTSTFFNLGGAGPVASFDVTLGVGRSNIRIPNFVSMQFSASTLNTGNPQLIVHSNSFTGTNGVNPGADPSPLGDTIRCELKDIPAHSIQVTGAVSVTGLVGFLDCEFTAFVAPRSHFRREWLIDDSPQWAQGLK